jgi:hypothetical protein
MNTWCISFWFYLWLKSFGYIQQDFIHLEKRMKVIWTLQMHFLLIFTYGYKVFWDFIHLEKRTKVVPLRWYEPSLCVHKQVPVSSWTCD